ncbi:hypothetical protein [Fulvimonas yonginensis]|uniref:Uncharacterized protein n=1 Tax=Fulvimonas yonginensis TaxID=1495200 RepID=A0ABU8JB53_9GAMM
MEDRAVILATVSSLARLQLRVHAKLAEARRMPNGVIWGGRDARWKVGELTPPSPWLDRAEAGEPLYNVLPRIALVQVYLLALLAEEEIDRRWACVALQHLAHSQAYWSAPVLRLASRFGITLGSRPWDETNGTGLLDAALPRRPRGGT